MKNPDASSASKPAVIGIVAGTACLAAALFVAAMVLAPRPADATQAFAAQTGKSCGACHKSPGGGGALTSAGKAFQKTHK